MNHITVQHLKVAAAASQGIAATSGIARQYLNSVDERAHAPVEHGVR